MSTAPENFLQNHQYYSDKTPSNSAAIMASLPHSLSKSTEKYSLGKGAERPPEERKLQPHYHHNTHTKVDQKNDMEQKKMTKNDEMPNNNGGPHKKNGKSHKEK